jgi:hypothetical protein
MNDKRNDVIEAARRLHAAAASAGLDITVHVAFDPGPNAPRTIPLVLNVLDAHELALLIERATKIPNPPDAGASTDAPPWIGTIDRAVAEGNGASKRVHLNEWTSGQRVRLSPDAPEKIRRLLSHDELERLVLRSVDRDDRATVRAGDDGPTFVVDASHLEAMP